MTDGICLKCTGTGKRPPTALEMEMLAHLPALASQLAKHFGVTSNVIGARLRKMARKGLVDRTEVAPQRFQWFRADGVRLASDSKPKAEQPPLLGQLREHLAPKQPPTNPEAAGNRSRRPPIVATRRIEMEEQTIRNVAVAPHSVSVSRNAKGDASFEVKCFGETPEQALERALAIEAALKARLTGATAGKE